MFNEASTQHMVISHKMIMPLGATYEATRVAQRPIWNSHIGAAEYSSLQRCYVVSIGKWLPTFRGIVMSSPSSYTP